MRYLTIAILLTTCVLLSAENHLDIVWEQQGEQPSDSYGFYVISLDFNGDGIDDLATSAYRHQYIDGYPMLRGKLYLYFGSNEGLPDSASMEVAITVDTTYSWYASWFDICNLGDMNGDGCDDIGYTQWERTYEDDYIYTSYCKILLGSTVNDTIPDYAFLVDDRMSLINPLGDINGDGYDDAGITEDNGPVSYYIVYGGSFEMVPFVEDLDTDGHYGFRGLGDVNGDGYDDFNYYYRYDWNGESYPYHNCFFFGGAVQDTVPNYHIVHHSANNTFIELAPAGDWNNDGYDDFVFTGYDIPEDGSISPGCRLWRGGEEINWDNYGYIEYYSFFYPAFGDLNNDGKGDLVKPYHIPTSNSGGILYFYLGDQNGTMDYHRGNTQAGYGMAYAHAVGDFDNDGFDDIAVGAYGNDSNYNTNWGYVYVYGGHDNLVEQDQDATDDETVPPADITFNAYPNPFNPEISFEIKSNQDYKNLRIEIFNTKGQKVEMIPIKTTRETITWNAGAHASGVYFCKLNAGRKILQTRKVTLIK